MPRLTKRAKRMKCIRNGETPTVIATSGVKNIDDGVAAFVTAAENFDATANVQSESDHDPNFLVSEPEGRQYDQLPTASLSSYSEDIDVICVGEIINSDMDEQYLFEPATIDQRRKICNRLGSTMSSNLRYKIHGKSCHTWTTCCLSGEFEFHEIIRDGNCFFRSLSLILTGNQDLYHMDLRQRLVDFEVQNQHLIEAHLWRDETFEEHVRMLELNGTWAHDTDIVAAANFLNLNIYVFTEYPKGSKSRRWLKYSPSVLFNSALDDHSESPQMSIYLDHKNSTHFDVVYRVHPGSSQTSLFATAGTSDVLKSSDRLTRTTSETQKMHYSESMKNEISTYSERFPGCQTSKKVLRESEKTFMKLQKDRIRKRDSKLKETPQATMRRKENNRINMWISRSNELPEQKALRLKKDREYTSIAREKELPERRSRRLQKARENASIARENELPKQRVRRLEKNRDNTSKARAYESYESRIKRLEKNWDSIRSSRHCETPEDKTARLSRNSRQKAAKRKDQTADDVVRRLLYDRTSKAKKRKEMSPSRIQTRKNEDKSRKRRKVDETSSLYLDEKLQQIRNDIEQKAHFAYICCSDMRFHCKGNIVKLNLRDAVDQTEYCRETSSRHQLKTSFESQKDRRNALLKQRCIINESSKSFDGFWYICHACKRTILKGRIPACNEKNYGFRIDGLPDYLATEGMSLNKCEQFLLKLIIPFVRVQHIPRSAEFKVTGPMICVEAQVKETIHKILPVDQDLVPICLKRKPEYKGNFIEQIVSKSKILKYYEYFKRHNKLFVDVEFDESKMDEFMKSSLEDIDDQIEWKNSQHNDDVVNERTRPSSENERDACLDDAENDSEDSSPDLPEENAGNPSAENFENEKDYDLPSYLTEISDDTLIDPFTKNENRDDISELIANAIIEQEEHSKRTKQKPKLRSISVAPGAEGEFQYWDKAEYLEEKAFPHLFPIGEGGYLSKYQEKGVTFANYIKQRILGIDPRFREDTTYMFFLFNIKEQLEIKRSYATFFRKSKMNRNKYDVRSLREADKSEIERTDLGYKVFKNVRGTAPYFQQVKNKVMAMIRQLGAPQIFLTMSAAEAQWTDLLIMLLQKERNSIVSKTEIESLSRTQVNQLLNRNVIDVTAHFSNRMKVLYGSLKKPGILSKYNVVDHFYRIEFQQRGSPHVHSLLWLQDDQGQTPPRYDGTDESIPAIVEFIDSVICGQSPTDNEDLLELVEFCQTHSHTFTCRKRSKKIKIKANEGHGRYDGAKQGCEITMDSCRFKFPRFPMRKTTIVKRPESNVEVETLKLWRENYLKVRKYLLRQTFENIDDGDFEKMTFDQFLNEVGLTEDEYLKALSMCAASSRSGAEVFLKRDCRDLWTNNYNPNILRVHRANIDVSYILDEYACVAYILGYLTKNESGLSRLLHQIEVESAKYGRTPTEKLKLFSRALDNSREVSRPEVVYRMLGLHFCHSTRTHAFIQTSHPNSRDGLMKGHLDELDDDDNPFFNSPVDYYVNRPDDLEHLSLAEFVRDYSIVYQSKAEKEANEHVNVAHREDIVLDEMAPGKIRFLKNRKGRFRRNNKAIVVRYHLSKKSDTEIKRDLLVLFHPFRDEVTEIHEPPGMSVDNIYDQHKHDIENVRTQFEPNRKLVLLMEELMDEYVTEDEPFVDDELIDAAEEPDVANEETTSAKELEHYLHLAGGKRSDEREVDITTRRKVCEMARQLNRDQRRIFDDVIERLLRVDTDDDSTNDCEPFYLYIAGCAGTGKTFLMKLIIEAAKLLLMRSGDDLDKPTVLVMSPTAAAAGVVGGQTIESALKLFRSDDSENYEVFSNRATCAYQYSQVRALFIDEVSMVGSNKLHQIHLRCEEMFGKKDSPFSALPVICTGDFHQLSPVQDRWIFDDANRQNRCDATAPNKWKLHFKMYELTEKMRSLEDPAFSEMCDRIATNNITDEDVAALRDRILECPVENSNDAYKKGDLAIIVRDNVTRERINSEKLDLIEGEKFTFKAGDVCRTADRYIEDAVSKLPYTQTGQLPFYLEVKIDSPVMLTTNLNKSDGLTNGTRGYVIDVDEKRAIVWVKFHGDVGKKTATLSRRKFDIGGKHGAVPIQKIKATFKQKGSVRIQRSQFPLVLAYAITSHKSQGQTLSNVIVDFSGNRRIDPGSFYVAVTRVKKLADLYLRQFDPAMIKTSSTVSKELSRLRSHARYEFANQPLYHDIFASFGKDSDEIRISYINVNGLLDANHIRDLESDINLTSSDVLCISETKIDASIEDERVQIENFNIVRRLDYRGRSMGMILYVRRDRSVEVNVHIETNHEEPKAQTVYIDANGIGVLFAYLHPSDSSMGLMKIEEQLTGGGEIVMGDLNIDYMKNADRQKLEQFAAKNGLQVSKMGPTCNRAQLDHILIPRFIRDSYKYCFQTFANMYSDHRAVSVRLSKNARERKH